MPLHFDATHRGVQMIEVPLLDAIEVDWAVITGERERMDVDHLARVNLIPDLARRPRTFTPETTFDCESVGDNRHESHYNYACHCECCDYCWSLLDHSD